MANSPQAAAAKAVALQGAQQGAQKSMEMGKAALGALGSNLTGKFGSFLNK